MDAGAVQAALSHEEQRWQRRVQELASEVRQFHDASRDTNADDEHDPEGATIAFERERSAGLLTAARHQLEEIAAARRRLADGSYGRCEVCGERIPSGRLQARPTARTCVACAG
ncbi:TraR/DksA C4-type zinc finger protein [Nocardioides maradonensis]